MENPEVTKILHELGLPAQLMFDQKYILQQRVIKLIRFSILLDLFTQSALVDV